MLNIRVSITYVKMRIYYASQSFYPFIGGVPTYLLNLAKEMVNLGNEVVEVHLRSSHADADDEIKGVKVHRVPREPINFDIMKMYSKFKESVYKECHENKNIFVNTADKMPGFFEFNQVNEYFGEQIKDLFEKESPDIVHIHDFQLLFAYKYVPRGTPLILTWHIPIIKNISKHLSNFLIKHLKQYDKVVFSSQEYIDAIVELGFPREKTELIYPIANTDLFKIIEYDKENVLTKYNLNKNDNNILSVQRVDPKSGHEQLVRALPRILEKVPNAKLVFVGGESLSNQLSEERKLMLEDLKNLIKELNIEDKVIFTGNIEYHILPELYNCIDVVALCSKNEGFGLSVTEGMACGNPIVATRVGGLPLQVQDGINGFLVEVNDIADTAAKIIKILTDKELKNKMKDNSINIVENNFKKEIGIKNHLSMYNYLIGVKDEFHKIEYLKTKEIKGIICDLDRTLIDVPAKRKFDPEDFKTAPFKELESLGIDLFLSTGRNIEFVKKLCETFPIWRAVIAENGAIIYFPKTKKTLLINTDYMKEVKEKVKELNLPNTTIGRVITSNRWEDKELIHEKLGDLFHQVNCVKNVDEMMLIPEGVEKGLATRITMQYLNIDIEKTIVIGDGENDIDLFQNPGFKIAVSNSSEKLKVLANQVTSLPASSGVKEVIQKLKE